MPNANLFLLGIPAWTVFAGVAAIGFVTLVAAPLTGGLLEHDAAVSAADGPDRDGFGIFNSRVVGVFLAAFGGGRRRIRLRVDRLSVRKIFVSSTSFLGNYRPQSDFAIGARRGGDSARRRRASALQGRRGNY
jgi:hypothetical protein